jgi:hypothetical protein
MSAERFEKLTLELIDDGRGLWSSFEQLDAHTERINRKAEPTWGDYGISFLHVLNVIAKGRKAANTLQQWTNAATTLPVATPPLVLPIVRPLPTIQPVSAKVLPTSSRRANRSRLSRRTKLRRQPSHDIQGRS